MAEETATVRIQQMHQKLKQPPQLLSSAAGKPTCSIFRVPQSMIEVNGKSYEPRVVSIGPLHRGEKHVKMIEEHKWRYLNALLARTNDFLCLEDYVTSVQRVEDEARECYSETIPMDSDEFNEVMVLDGCFILECFRKVAKLVPFDPDDPIVAMSWILPFFYRDFLRLENQIPYFVLEILFDLTKDQESNVSLSSLAFNFFNNVMHRTETDLARFKELGGKHLLDLVRTSLLPASDLHAPPPRRRPTPSHIIHSISKLRRAGIKLRELSGDDEERTLGLSFLVVRFRHGVIEMPTITIDDFMSSFLQNCVAYEQCHVACSKHFTTYATFLDCLINTYVDVEYLCDRNIVENYFGTEGEVASFVNKLGKDVAFDINECYLSDLFNQVHEYYKSSWHVQWASFKYTYFSSPWSFISALAALVLLVLSILQTFYTVYQVYM
ncbi:PREDICTED: UPF0481 protein At3g47200 [Tarenaya hassleriana]|uniref:UPF0481 protein At3g47200 n=1 Tax=Tarenaya hassleriana TaxID=28532 RepID=UPI00053C61A5|nr:PREDICTED: UPF0481 protein At3g47200 [Tarenaya hassleriana]